MPSLAVKTCAVCERTLLMGELATRFAPGLGSELVEVCPLCHEEAQEHGWIREGSPSVPTMQPERRRRGLLAGLFETRRAGAFEPRRHGSAAEPATPTPARRRMSPREAALAEAADHFNSSPYRRTVAGIAKSLGAPNASIVHLSGVNKEVVITVAWEISWYQYRVSLDSLQAVRLAERGTELEALDASFQQWNAEVDDEGRLHPNVARR